jgi:hypothetical protein
MTMMMTMTRRKLQEEDVAGEDDLGHLLEEMTFQISSQLREAGQATIRELFSVLHLPFIIQKASVNCQKEELLSRDVLSSKSKTIWATCLLHQMPEDNGSGHL